METSVILIAIFTGVMALSSIILLGGLAYLAIAVSKLLKQSVQPAISEVTDTVRTVNHLVERVEEKAENILDISEQTARRVSGKAEEILDISEQTARRVSGSVVATTEVVEHSVAQPFINLSGIIAGINRALNTLRRPA